MRVRKAIIVAVSVLSITFMSCNRQVGCPASQATQKSVNISNEKDGVFNGKKADKARKSSVMPREIRAK